MHVGELWRFPVKSMRGEQLESARLTMNGVAGDRLVHIRGARGVLTARTRTRLLGLTATTGRDGEILVDGHPWESPAATALIRAAAGADAEPVRFEGRERFDIHPLLVASDGGIHAFGYDGRRLRANVVIEGVPGLAERWWPGKALRINDVVIGVAQLRPRCVVTTVDPDTGELDPNVLRRINRELDGRLALDCWVASEGDLRVGDPVELVEEDLVEPDRGGWILGAPYAIR
jgi:uncharacterized protein